MITFSVCNVVKIFIVCRPSGTEDVVRVYAEADTQVLAYDYRVKFVKVVVLMLGFVM